MKRILATGMAIFGLLAVLALNAQRPREEIVRSEAAMPVIGAAVPSETSTETNVHLTTAVAPAVGNDAQTVSVAPSAASPRRAQSPAVASAATTPANRVPAIKSEPVTAQSLLSTGPRASERRPAAKPALLPAEAAQRVDRVTHKQEISEWQREGVATTFSHRDGVSGAGAGGREVVFTQPPGVYQSMQ